MAPVFMERVGGVGRRVSMVAVKISMVAVRELA